MCSACYRKIACNASLPAPREILFGQGEIVIRQGDAGQSLYLIEEGQVVVSASIDGQSTVEINRLGAGRLLR